MSIESPENNEITADTFPSHEEALINGNEGESRQVIEALTLITRLSREKFKSAENNS